MLKDFKEFVARANVIDLAVGVIIGAALGKIVTSLVEGIIMPPIGLLLGKVDFASLFLVLDHSKGVPVSLADAKAKVSVTSIDVAVQKIPSLDPQRRCQEACRQKGRHRREPPGAGCLR